MSSSWFDPSFDKAVNDALVRSVRQRRGCFFCGAKAGVNLVCSRCHVACYCNRDCQRADWKGGHKSDCAVHCENRDHPAGFSFGEVLKGGHLIDVDALGRYMSDRRGAFFRHVAEAHSADRRAVLHLASSAVWQFQRVWIAGEASFWGGDVLRRVNCVLFVPIDKGERAKTRLQDARPGKLSKAALRNAHDVLVAYAKEVHKSNGEIGGITFGSGLLDQVGNKDLMDRMRATGCEVALEPTVAVNHMGST